MGHTTFAGKCLTILTGIALSWITVTNPEVDRLAAHLLRNQKIDDAESIQRQPGQTQPDQPVQHLANQVELAIQPDPTKTTHPSTIKTVTPTQDFTSLAIRNPDTRIDEISSELKQMGASYLRLERLAGSEANQFRARCDLAREQSTVKCCFEATRETPLAAMEEVLRVARHNVSASRGDFPR